MNRRSNARARTLLVSSTGSPLVAEPVQWDAHAYDDVSQIQLEWGRRVLARRAWRGDEVVLDAGCGTGQLVPEILGLVPRGSVIAVDKDPRMIQAATQRLSSLASKVRLVQSDLLELEGIGPVDVIFSNAVLHYVADHDELFARFMKALKPGGTLLLQCGGEGNLKQFRATIARIQTHAPFREHFRTWTPPWHFEDEASTQERLFIAGFVNPQVRLEPVPTRFPSRDAFEKFVSAVVLLPHIQALPQGPMRSAFVRDVLNEVEASRSGWMLDYVRLNIQAQRSPHP